MTGKMKIKGNMAAATKFTPDLFPKYTPENLAKYKNAKLWVIKSFFEYFYLQCVEINFW